MSKNNTHSLVTTYIIWMRKHEFHEIYLYANALKQIFSLKQMFPMRSLRHFASNINQI